MRPLFLLRFWYKLLRWSGRPDARPTEFAATEQTFDRPGASDSNTGPADAARHATRGAPVNEAPSAPPSHIGRYEIKGRLGAGGLGEVFEAWDPLLSRNLAVKTLRLQLDPELRALLDDHILNEARAAAGLSHPNIVTVFDAGLCTPGVYIAMERLHGRDLRQRLAQGWRPTPLQAAQLARRVAEALAYAHDEGVVHCDIKPGNIFLDASDRPKVLDFGIARIAHDKALPASNEPLFGSPHYLAPEQLQRGQADARTDVRALGVVLYELLTGRKAFAGDTVEQVVNAVLLNHPAPAHEVDEQVPRTLSAITAKAMAREPAQRYASADAMAAELRGWCERHAPRSTAPDDADIGTIDRQQPASGRRAPHRSGRAGWGWAAAGGAVCMAAAAWLWWLSGTAGGSVNVPSAATGSPGPNAEIKQSYSAISTAASSNPAPDKASLTASKAASKVASKTASNTAAASPPATPANRKVPGQTAAARRPNNAAAAAGNGAVLLSISPWGEVEVNGQKAGTTPPLTRLTLPAGRHTITVKNDDFPVYTTSVVVQADKPALVRHRFAQ